MSSDQKPLFDSETVVEMREAPPTVYVVVTRYDGSPHPQCEGVYEREEDARDMIRNCRDTFEEPREAIAWEMHEMKVTEAPAGTVGDSGENVDGGGN